MSKNADDLYHLALETLKGGPGSGNRGHAGRPGHVSGSMPTKSGGHGGSRAAKPAQAEGAARAAKPAQRKHVSVAVLRERQSRIRQAIRKAGNSPERKAALQTKLEKANLAIHKAKLRKSPYKDSEYARLASKEKLTQRMRRLAWPRRY